MQTRFAGVFLSLGAVTLLLPSIRGAGQNSPAALHYKVLFPTIEGNLAVYPVVSGSSFDTSQFLSLDEGIRSGQVVVTEAGQPTGLIRPRPRQSDGVWRERPIPAPLPPVEPPLGPRVNELALINNSDRPLILLAGEIVTGGKQDRVVGKDRIVPAHSAPVALGVFCVEPHRWTGVSASFGSLNSSFAQPSVRRKAMAEQNQQEVWAEVQRSRDAFAAAVPPAQAGALGSSSSYAVALENGGVQRQLDSITGAIERSYEKSLENLRAEKALGVVIAINGQLLWADVFASPALLQKYWPKLIRSYAAEALGPHISSPIAIAPPSAKQAQNFLAELDARREEVESEPGIYRTTEFLGEDFEAFFLTSLLPGSNFNVHVAKMRR